jgi:hypothetical protein
MPRRRDTKIFYANLDKFSHLSYNRYVKNEVDLYGLGDNYKIQNLYEKEVCTMGIREEKAKFSAEIVNRIENCLKEEFGDIFHTGDNYNTLTFEVGSFGGSDLYGSVKFTLHKPTYDIDFEIEEFEDFFEMREKAAKEAEKKRLAKEAAEKEKEERRQAKKGE